MRPSTHVLHRNTFEERPRCSNTASRVGFYVRRRGFAHSRVSRGDSVNYPGRRVILLRSSATSMQDCWTERAVKSLTRLPEASANSKAVLRDRCFKSMDSRGSKGALERPSKTVTKSHLGKKRRDGGRNLRAPFMKRMTRGKLPTGLPSAPV